MSFEPISSLHVSIHLKSEILPIGRLALLDRKILFEYFPEFIETNLEISPFKLPLKSGVQICKDYLFSGLFGVFNDSLPDGWGHLLLDRKLRQTEINPNYLSPLDRLRYVGHLGMGALIYHPEIEVDNQPNVKNLDDIAEEIHTIVANEDDYFVDHLLALNGSSAGARPKIVTRLDNQNWLIKFRSVTDPNDIAPIEFAYHLMAKEAGLKIPIAKLFPSKKGAGYFGVKRFDRNNNERIHMHTLSGLLHADHRLPSLDYETLLKATTLLTKDKRETEKQYRATVFNVLSHNRDDHAKNFSFLMDETGRWSVSPAYDLTFSSGLVGEHCTTIMGEGKKPTRQHLFKLAETADIKKETARKIIDEVKEAVNQWPKFANIANVSNRSLKMIQEAISGILTGL